MGRHKTEDDSDTPLSSSVGVMDGEKEEVGDACADDPVDLERDGVDGLSSSPVGWMSMSFESTMAIQSSASVVAV